MLMRSHQIEKDFPVGSSKWVFVLGKNDLLIQASSDRDMTLCITDTLSIIILALFVASPMHSFTHEYKSNHWSSMGPK